MKKKLLFVFAVLTLRGLPKSGDIDTLYNFRFNYLFLEYYHTNDQYTIYCLSLQSPVGSHQTLKVYDVLGNEVATLVDEYKPGGRYEVQFDASSSIRSASGGLTSGIYFYQLRATPYGRQVGEFIQTKKMILLR